MSAVLERSASAPADARAAASLGARPRLGFLGVGWIGRNRMEALAADDCAELCGVSDAARSLAEDARAIAPRAHCVDSLDQLLDLGLDGVVIATPSALHAEQSRYALERGVAVFCQKPLARTAAETAAVLDAARRADRLLGIDMSYRHTLGMQRVRELVTGGALGEIYAVDLVFHNAYGPDKPWFRDPALSGGGCVIDLGIHLVDLALWTLGFPQVKAVSSRLYSKGARLPAKPAVVEDYASAELELAGGAHARLACSWDLAAGCDAVIAATFHGTRGGAALRNVNGSFYDFIAEQYEGTRTSRLAEPPDAWGGRAAVAWARRLAADRRFDTEIERIADVASVLDAIYGR